MTPPAVTGPLLREDRRTGSAMEGEDEDDERRETSGDGGRGNARQGCLLTLLLRPDRGRMSPAPSPLVAFDGGGAQCKADVGAHPGLGVGCSACCQRRGKAQYTCGSMLCCTLQGYGQMHTRTNLSVMLSQRSPMMSCSR